jgi:hypothetical protein
LFPVVFTARPHTPIPAPADDLPTTPTPAWVPSLPPLPTPWIAVPPAVVFVCENVMLA